MTAQEIFDKVWHHMAAQKVQSFKKNGFCAYRGEGGKACAVGCLLDDETASKFDNLGDPAIYDIERDYQSMIPKELVSHIKLLHQLQEAHDRYPPAGPWFLETFQDSAREIAKRFGLTVPEEV